jgi:hypothetical protein
VPERNPRRVTGVTESEQAGKAQAEKEHPMEERGHGMTPPSLPSGAPTAGWDWAVTGAASFAFASSNGTRPRLSQGDWQRKEGFNRPAVTQIIQKLGGFGRGNTAKHQGGGDAALQATGMD